jgi:ribosome maturation factor RimP
MRQEVTEKIRDIADRFARAADAEVVDIELLGGGKHRVLRIYIDKQPSVTLADCEAVSNGLEAVLDEQDLIPGGQYTLEVSSPGVERKLNGAKDFERVVGKKVKVVLREPVRNSSTCTGVLRAFAEDVLTLETAAGEATEIRLDNVKRANLKFEW